MPPYMISMTSAELEVPGALRHEARLFQGVIGHGRLTNRSMPNAFGAEYFS